MRRLFLLIFSLLLGLPAVVAQTDAPPRQDRIGAPDRLPPVPSPTPRTNHRLTIDFIGNAQFNAARLRSVIERQIHAIEEYGLDPANAYDAAFFVASFYRKQGYTQVDTTEKILGPWNLRITIDEGPLTLISEVNIIGNEAYDTETLTNYLLGPIRERYPRIREVTRLPFVQTDVQSGTDLVRRLYDAEGYLNAQIDGPEIRFNAAQTEASITLTIHEGIQFRFGEIRWEGDLIFTPEKLLAEVAKDTGNIFTDGRLSAAERKLEDYYRNRGYYQAKVTATGSPDLAVNGKVPVVFQISAGPLFHFDGITVAGNNKVQTRFIEKRMRNMQGKVYDPALIDSNFRTLIGTGLFRNVRIAPKVMPNDEIRLDVSVEEAKTKEFGLGLGYASFDGYVVDLSYTDRNIFRSGRPITFNIEATGRGYSGEILYTDPWLFDSDYSFKARLYALSMELKGYSKSQLGFMPTLERDITKHWKVGALIDARAVLLRDVLIEPESLVGPDSYTIVSLGLTQTLDYRDSAVIPTKGFIFNTALTWSPQGISDISLFRAVARFSYYIPVTAKSSLALGARAGIATSLDDDYLPIDERFFNGGATTVRSFSELTLGPKDRQGYPIGGEAFTVFNIEYTFPIWGELYGAVFCDAGNVIPEASQFGLENMRYGVGGGLRYYLPIGALRLDYGLNPDPAKGEAQGAFHFAIGVAF